jgi:O-antigen/teichoic acid export membrane protein
MFFLYAQIFGTLLASLAIYFSANAKFHYIKEKYGPLSANIKKKIQSNISILFLHKLATVVVFGSDFIMISALVGLVDLGLYSNYTLVITTIAIFVNIFILGADASIGNAIATLKEEELYNVFKKISALIFCISGISAVCFLNLLNPFIEFWIGESFVLPYSVAVVMSINFFLMQNRAVVLTFKYNAGLFRPDMYKPIIEVAFNLGLSIILALHYGVLGVVIGTLANTVLVCIGAEAYIVHKHLFKCKVWIYAKSYLVQISALLVACAISLYINSFVNNFIIKCLVSISVSIFIYFLFFFHTEEFKYFVALGRKVVRNK